jgi:hypothetical protein
MAKVMGPCVPVALKFTLYGVFTYAFDSTGGVTAIGQIFTTSAVPVLNPLRPAESSTDRMKK